MGELLCPQTPQISSGLAIDERTMGSHQKLIRFFLLRTGLRDTEGNCQSLVSLDTVGDAATLCWETMDVRREIKERAQM